MARIIQNNDWLESRNQGGYTAYWHGNQKGLYMIVQTSSANTLYFVAMEGSRIYNTFAEALADRASITYVEYNDMLNDSGRFRALTEKMN